jgi:hypothetical protein
VDDAAWLYGILHKRYQVLRESVSDLRHSTATGARSFLLASITISALASLCRPRRMDTRRIRVNALLPL